VIASALKTSIRYPSKKEKGGTKRILSTTEGKPDLFKVQGRLTGRFGSITFGGGEGSCVREVLEGLSSRY